MPKWLILIYRIPREPSAPRVAVWRKLKQIGAISLQDAAWVLPKQPRTREQFQWLAAEITEHGGNAILWEAEELYETDSGALLRQFTDGVDADYREILAALKKKRPDLAYLSSRFQAAQAVDFFQSPLGCQTRDELLAAGKEKTL